MTAAGSVAAAEPPARLRRELSRLDTVFFLMSAMVVLDTIGAIAIGGAQTFTWLVVLFITFFVPSALVTAELGTAIPAEGGAYAWVRATLGRFPSSVTSLLYWACTPVWLGGSVTAMALAVATGFFGSMPTGATYAFGIVFVLAATVPTVVPLRYGKWVPSSGAIGQVLLLTFFTVTVVLYGVRHGVHGIALGGFGPTPTIFIAVVPILIYSFTGVELPSSAAEEMRDPRRDIPAAILRAGIAQALMYGVPTLAVLLVLPPEQITSLHGLVDAMRTVFTVYGGSVAADGTATLSGAGLVLARVGAVVFVWVLLASGSAWIMGAGRTQAAACQDGAGPRWLGHVCPRRGVPVRMGWVSGAVSAATVVASIWATRGDGQEYFSAALSSAIALIVLSYVIVFPSFLVLRRRQPSLDRPFRVPGGRVGAWVAGGLATAWSAVASACLLWPGVGTRHPDDALPAAFAGERWRYEVLVLAPVVVVLVLASAFHVVRRRRPGYATVDR